MRKVFVFRKDPSDAFVVLRARLEQPLHNFTVCLRSYSDLSRPHSLFSYATKAQDNEILLFKPKPEEYRFYVGGKFVTFRVPESRRDWEHVCASWESATGIAEFWFNGKPWPRKGLQRGYTVGATASILWDAGLSPEKMRAAFLSLRLPPALLAWKSLSWAPTPARPPAAGAGLWPPTPRPYSLFSYATKTQSNDILLFKPKPGQYELLVGNKPLFFTVPTGLGESEHVCFSWESSTGIVGFWFNGKPWPRKGLQKGYTVGVPAHIVLGQDQDSFGGGFDTKQSFVGEISSVYMWDTGISNSGVVSAMYDSPEQTPVFGWRNFPYKIVGEVYLKP